MGTRFLQTILFQGLPDRDAVINCFWGEALFIITGLVFHVTRQVGLHIGLELYLLRKDHRMGILVGRETKGFISELFKFPGFNYFSLEGE